MAITLPEEFLLLVLEDEGGEFGTIGETALSCGMAGAALMELALSGRVDSDLHGVWVENAAPTGSAVLDRMLAAIGAEPQRLPAREWIKRLMPDALALRTEALHSLCDRGILRREEQVFLWVAKSRRYPVEQDGERIEAKRRLLALIFSDDIPDPGDVALVALADACGVFERILTPAVLSDALPRIRQLRRMDLIGAVIADTTEEINREIRSTERRTVIAGLAGNVMEWYDFGIYGFFAAVIGQQFFPAGDASLSLLASFGVFAVGFIGRPLGALVFGHLGDAHGRKKALIISVLTMTVPTALMALMPTHAQIGVAAPVLLILLRLAQGLAVGGEYTTSMVLMVEESQRSRRGVVGSFAPFGACGGMLLGSVLGATITGLLTPEQTAAWGWRLAFLLGLVIGVVVIFVRRGLPEDEAITVIENARSAPIVEAMRTQWATILKLVGIVSLQAASFYLTFVYLTTWLAQQTSVPRAELLFLNGGALLVHIALLPLAGRLSDRIGRKPLMLIAAVAIAVFAWPLLGLMSHGSIAAIVAGQLGMSFLVAGIGGPIAAYMVESIPKEVRCTALSVGYNLAQAGFGGTLPLVAVYLIQRTGDALSPALYLSVLGVFAALVLLLSGQERREGV